METKKVNINTNGIDIILFIVFLVLKLCGVIEWKWIWVFSPLWIMLCIQVLIWITTIIVIAIANREPKRTSNVSYGKPLVWDAKTNTLYGPWTKEDNTNGNNLS